MTGVSEDEEDEEEELEEVLELAPSVAAGRSGNTAPLAEGDGVVGAAAEFRLPSTVSGADGESGRNIIEV